MTKLSKRKEYFSTLEERKYSISEAIQFLKSAPKRNFEESVDVSINLGIDASKSDQTVRSAISLPAGTGKPCKVAVFSDAEQAKGQAFRSMTSEKQDPTDPFVRGMLALEN